MIELDSRLDYKAIFEQIVKNARISGNSMSGLCPIHKDRRPSFSVDLSSGKWHCFACGEGGNYVSLYAKLNNCDTKEAHRRICLENHIGQEAEQQKTSTQKTVEDKPFAVADYCRAKHFDQRWLETFTGIAESGKDSDGYYIKIPYYDEKNQPVLFRKRYAPGVASRFKWGRGSAGKLCFYGLWVLEYARDQGFVILVEGESDCHALWAAGLPALGVPGASTFKTEWTDLLTDIKVFVHVEPDNGGQVFREQVSKKLIEGGFEGDLYEFSCSDIGEKDPSDAYIKFGAGVKEKIEGLLKGAKRIDTNNIPPMPIKNAPIQLSTPLGWYVSNDGIFRVDAKTGETSRVCRVPILLTRRMIGHDTGEEKVEVAFRRDHDWIKAIYPRTTIFASRSITELAKIGATVTSENAKSIVSFLSALEAENMNNIPACPTCTTLGWHEGNFLPWHEGSFVLDVSPQMARWASACQKTGSLEAWILAMAPHRDRYRFRFILASSFAAPLLQIVKGRSFVVYNWANSRGGKTAALKAALSAWGDPEKLMVTFNATRFAFEKMATFFTDLPIGIDERQLAGNNQEGIEALVYMMSNGVSRGRGTKDGGIQEISTWRTVALTTGEEPLSTDTTMTGVSTRTLEIVGAPFDDEEQASEIHKTASENTGHAGCAFIKNILTMKPEELKAIYDVCLNIATDAVGNANGSHVAALATVAMADILIGNLFFDETTSQDKTIDMINCIGADITANQVKDVNIGAAGFVSDWLEQHEENFTTDKGQRFGTFDEISDIAFVFPSPLREAMSKSGFSFGKTMSWMMEKEIIENCDQGRYTIVKKINGRSARVICINRAKLIKQFSDKNQ